MANNIIKQISVSGSTYDVADADSRTELANNVIKSTSQTLTTAQKLQARLNIEAMHTAVNITYAELKALKDASQLEFGRTYRITDFVTTTAQANTQSGNHAFDLIVTATSTSELSEVAHAAVHSGDTYFANYNLNGWEVKYDINNDTTKYSWADSTNGKGVIYYLKDEFNNEAYYDFKNIMYLGSSLYNFTSGLSSILPDTNYYYTFHNPDYGDYSLCNGEAYSDGTNCANNKIGIVEGDNYRPDGLPFICLISAAGTLNDLVYNTFDSGAQYITVYPRCQDCTFLNYAYYIYALGSLSYCSFNGNCHNIVFNGNASKYIQHLNFYNYVCNITFNCSSISFCNFRDYVEDNIFTCTDIYSVEVSNYIYNLTLTAGTIAHCNFINQTTDLTISTKGILGWLYFINAEYLNYSTTGADNIFWLQLNRFRGRSSTSLILPNLSDTTICQRYGVTTPDGKMLIYWRDGPLREKGYYIDSNTDTEWKSIDNSLVSLAAD